MSNGMKKFTKGCLLTALIAFMIGSMICLIGALLGGFRQLKDLNIKGITGIPFVYYKNDGFFYGFGDNDYSIGLSDGEWADYEKWDSINSPDKLQLDLTADSLHNLYIELGACTLSIEESQDDHVWLSMSGDTGYFRYREENNGSLYLVRREDIHYWKWRHNTPRIHLYLPKEAALDDIDIMIGACTMESVSLKAHEINVEVGAGTCSFDALTSDGSVDLSVGAGKIVLKTLDANEANMEIGAGDLYIDGAQIWREADIDIGMGNAEISGVIAGDLDADCGMGNLTLRLDGAEQDHNYEIDCSMGNVRIGSRSYTGLADEKSIWNGGGSTFEIDCSMGNVNIIFAE